MGVPITAEAKVLGERWIEKTEVRKPAAWPTWGAGGDRRPPLPNQPTNEGQAMTTTINTDLHDLRPAWETACAALRFAFISALAGAVRPVEVNSVDELAHATGTARVEGLCPDLKRRVAGATAVVTEAMSRVTPYPLEDDAAHTVILDLEDITEDTSPLELTRVLTAASTLIMWLTAGYPVRCDVTDWEAENSEHGDANGVWDHDVTLPDGWAWAECRWCSSQFPFKGIGGADDEPLWCSENCKESHLGD
jgi:hypothetical protein